MSEERVNALLKAYKSYAPIISGTTTGGDEDE
jgi:hypothetical protein